MRTGTFGVRAIHRPANGRARRPAESHRYIVLTPARRGSPAC